MIDFSSLKYPIHNIPEDEKCITHFPELLDLAHIFDNSADMPPDVSPDKAMRYMIYMYDPNTPLKTYFPDLKKRKSTALSLINVVPNEDGSVTEGYNELCSLSANWAIQRFVHFCLIHDTGNLLIAETNFEMMGMLAEKLLTDVSAQRAGDLKVLREQMDEARIAYEQATDRMLKEEANSRVLSYVKFVIRNEKLGIRPEDYIRAYAERGDVFKEVIP